MKTFVPVIRVPDSAIDETLFQKLLQSLLGSSAQVISVREATKDNESEIVDRWLQGLDE